MLDGSSRLLGSTLIGTMWWQCSLGVTRSFAKQSWHSGNCALSRSLIFFHLPSYPACVVVIFRAGLLH